LASLKGVADVDTTRKHTTVPASTHTKASAKAADAQDRPSNLQKDPDEWTTGDESMTDAQRSYLKTLSDEAKEEFHDDLTKAEASKRIDELQHRTGRGVEH
jgi:hypothetical protein